MTSSSRNGYFCSLKNYLADNYHLHQLLFKYLSKNKFFKKKYLISSFTGIFINLYLIIIYMIGYVFYSKTNIQVFLMLISVFIYIVVYIFCDVMESLCICYEVVCVCVCVLSAFIQKYVFSCYV